MAFLTKKTPEEKAAARAEKEARKAEARARMEESFAEWRAERASRRDELDLVFETDVERDRARDILNRHAI